jgi:hypothetical protein
MPAGLQYARGDIASQFTNATATVTSGPVGNPGDASVVLAGVHLTALTGTTPTATLSVEQSANGSSGWTTVAGSTAVALSAAGTAQVMVVATANYVRTVLTLAGTTPSATGAVAVIVFGD